MFQTESADILPTDVAHVSSEGKGESPIYREHLLLCFIMSLTLLQSKQS